MDGVTTARATDHQRSALATGAYAALAQAGRGQWRRQRRSGEGVAVRPSPSGGDFRPPGPPCMA